MTQREGRAREFEELQDEVLRLYGVAARSRFVTLDKPPVRAHVLEVGDGEPLVVLHGGDGEAVNWAPLMGVLGKDARIYAVDRPGFGLSDAFDYRTVDLRRHAEDVVGSLLDALGLEGVTLVGGSMGGFFALSGALAHPSRVTRLVLVGYPVGLTRSLALPTRIICGVAALARLSTRKSDTLAGQRKQYQRMFKVDPDTVPELYFRARIAGVRMPGVQERWATILHRIGGFGGLRPEVDLGADLAHLRQPTLVIWGENETFDSAANGRQASERITNARFIELPGIGHFPFLEAPDETARLIIEFIDSTRHDLAQPVATGAVLSPPG